ncbi:TetR/AcrR family transcriptional regulator [Methanoculleus chikugoensis]|uniref:TetR/AcrR family transcriptional regulator n=1 Tax=Methanoculleus chikugoensis TaxID=118126 RepID=UPI001FB4E942|nr:helix-turn-helix domain-containing protein [Methanoculleus chikugoensis]
MTEDRDRKKTAIVATAVRLFTERGGFHGTPPTSLIAREAGISNGTLFHYFPTKEELINFAYFDIEVVPKPLCREGDTRSHLAVLKLPPVAPPPRTLHRVAIPDGKPFHPPLARDIVQRGETSEVSVPIRECGTFRIFSG